MNIDEPGTVEIDIAAVREAQTIQRSSSLNREFAGFAVPLRSGFGIHAIAAILSTPHSIGQEEQTYGAITACRDAIEVKLGAQQDPKGNNL